MTTTITTTTTIAIAIIATAIAIGKRGEIVTEPEIVGTTIARIVLTSMIVARLTMMLGPTTMATGRVRDPTRRATIEDRLR